MSKVFKDSGSDDYGALSARYASGVHFYVRELFATTNLQRNVLSPGHISSMSSLETRYEHIILDEDQVPVIAGTNMKVVELVLGKVAYGWSPEELHFQHPYLILGQIHAALAYHWDHKEAVDEDIERRLAKVDQIERATEPAPLLARLKSKGLI